MTSAKPSRGLPHPVVVPSTHHVRTAILTGLFLLAVGLFLVFNRADFSETVSLLRDAPIDLILLGGGLVAGSYAAAAVSYCALGADRRLGLLRTLDIQIASGITNRLLPAGLGAAGLYALYLKRSGFKYSQATALVAANNILGAAGNALLIVAVLLAAPRSDAIPQFRAGQVTSSLLVVVTVVVLMLLVFRHAAWLKRSLLFIRDMVKNLGHALKPSRRTAVSLLCNMIITSLNGLVLSLAVLAAGGTMYWPLAIVVLSVGALLGAAVPTPGGLGGVEAGILGGLVACGVPSAAALAATVIYRGLTYWMPILPGLLMLPWVRHRYLP